MKTEFIAVPKNYTAQQTINFLRKLKPAPGTAYHLYIVDKNKHLVGVLPVRALLVADPKSKIEKSMNKKIVFVKDDSPKETAARLMARYDLIALPVIDKEGILKGLVKADDVIDEYIPARLKREKFLPLKLRNNQNGFS